VPTLAAGEVLEACLRALESQTVDEFEVVVIDNSGTGRVRASSSAVSSRVRVIANDHNVGFGAAVNQAFRASSAPYLATLNDDAVANPRWLEKLLAEANAHPRIGMFASEVRLAGTENLDSAGMLIAADGSSKQRRPPAALADAEALLPSGSAALYRRTMLEEIGLFDESFFLYCEDTDLGLRAQWAGWGCRYVPGAVVEHRYSHTAGRASPLKAYYVERNRLYTIVKNFPAAILFVAPFASIVRYFWHVTAIVAGRGKAAEYRDEGHSAVMLPWLVIRAHVAALFRLPKLLASRNRIRAMRRISSAEFRELLRRHSITVRQVAAL
jgi:GT2 family glycosyltransferase